MHDETLSVRRQCRLLDIPRSNVYYKKKPRKEPHAEHRQKVVDIHTALPFYGYRKMHLELERRHGIALSRKQMRRLMRKMKIKAMRPKKNTSVKHPEHPVYPYLLNGKVIRYPNQVWSTDLTYIKLPGIGYVYLVAIIDIYSRKVLSWKISNSMDAGFCEEALKEALAIYGSPAIFNTDQGSQFTSYGFIQILQEHHIQISMDGQGRWKDNIYIERLWRTVKYEDIYLQGYEDLRSLKKGVGAYFRFYNQERFHQSLDYETPNMRYESFQEGYAAAS
jgi:putative transposase